MKPKKKKLKAAILGLTSCEGCSFALIDLGKKFFDSLEHFRVGDFHLVQEPKDLPDYDVVFVDGSPLTRENDKILKKFRKKAKILVSLGDCATQGVIPNIKNYADKKKAVKYVYPETYPGVFNPNIVPVRRRVKVDFEIFGCPLDGRDFIKMINDIREGATPRPYENPVCYECQINGNECLLQKGEPCLGPVIRGGCDAVCLNSKFYCKGCREVIPEMSVSSLDKKLVSLVGKKKLNQILQLFGIQEEWIKANK